MPQLASSWRQRAWLEASALGLGNVWVGSFDPAVIAREFPQTAGYEVVCLFPVGHPDMGPGPKHELHPAVFRYSPSSLTSLSNSIASNNS